MAPPEQPPVDTQPANADAAMDFHGAAQAPATAMEPDFSQVGVPPAPGQAGTPPLPAPAPGPSMAQQMPLPAYEAPKTIGGAINASAKNADESAAAAQVATRKQQEADAAMAKLEGEEAKALAPTLQHQKDAADALVSFKQQVVQHYDMEFQKRQTAYATTQQDLDALRAQMHPTDIFGAAGVSPVRGTIAIILGAIGGLNDGRNTGVERLDQLAKQRAGQLQQEAQLIEKKGNMQENMFQIARQKLGDDQSAYLATYEAQLEAVKAETQQVANNFRSPRAQAAARQAIAALDQKLVAVQTQIGQQHSQQALQGATAIGQQALEWHALKLKESTKPEGDKTEARRMAEAAAATEEAVRLIREIKSGRFSPLENAAKRSQLATVMAKAENPGSSRVLGGDTRRAEIEKTGGIAIPFTGGKIRIGDASGLDNLEQQLIRQQHERDIYTGGDTASRLMNEPQTQAAGILQNAPVHNAGN